jgi:hypothetical protein
LRIGNGGPFDGDLAIDVPELLYPAQGGAGIYADPQNLPHPSRGGAGIYACDIAVKEIGFSRRGKACRVTSTCEAI